MGCVRAARLLVMTFGSRIRATFFALSAAALVSCEGGASHVDGPKGANAFARFVALGTGLSMGVQSGGVLYESQVESWPALLARGAAVSFRIPLLRAPGCQPPRIAPLQLGVYLSGVSTTLVDSSCAGLLDTLTPPVNSLAISGASAYAALNLTPKIVVNSAVPYPAGDRARYPLVLASTQSQVTALRIQGATFVSVELGLTEVLGAATSGLLVPATSYTQTAPYTYVPATLFAPVFGAITDSVKLTGAKVVLLSVPKVTSLYAMRTAAELWSDRAELATYGINVTADCATSANVIFTGALVPALAAKFASTGAAQNLSCTDVPGAADAILTPADVSALDAVVTQMNAQIQQVAQTNGWAFADLSGVFPYAPAKPAYVAADQLTCVFPYGGYTSLDGVFPNAAGQQLIAYAAASAINTKYGFTLSIGPTSPTGVLAVKLCP